MGFFEIEKERLPQQCGADYSPKSELLRLQKEIFCCDSIFNMTDDENLIESCIFERKALLSEYSYAMARARGGGD